MEVCRDSTVRLSSGEALGYSEVLSGGLHSAIFVMVVQELLVDTPIYLIQRVLQTADSQSEVGCSSIGDPLTSPNESTQTNCSGPY